MRFAYLGTSDFAVCVLRGLVTAGQVPALVVAPPDRGRGRGRRLEPPPVARAASELGLELHQTADASERPSCERIAAAADLGIVCAFGQLIRAPLLGAVPLLNVHPSLLPRWRGAAPIERALIAGDDVTGVTIMRVEAGLDSGPIALQERVEVGQRETFPGLASRLAELGARLAGRALDQAEAGALEWREQDDSLATYAEKVTAAERRLDPGRPAAELDRVVRALGARVGVHVELRTGERLGVLEAEPVAAGPAPGELAADDGSLLWGCREGALRLLRVQPPGGRPMPADAYLRGHPLGGPARR